MATYDNNLFYACSLIEYIGRVTKNRRGKLIDYIKGDVERIYQYADVFHCEPIESVADEFIERNQIPTGDYDIVSGVHYDIPDYWDIGEVFERLIEDVFPESERVRGVMDVFSSWMADEILNFNSDLYYQSREYLAECYRCGEIIDG